MTKPQTQGRLLWCDAEANCHRLSTHAQVAEVVEKALRAGINTLIVDVKPLSGEVLYNSKYAPRLGEVDGKAFPTSFDLLAAAVEEGRSQGLRIHAAVNVFSEGHREWARGPAYEHPEWQAAMYEAVRTISFGDESIGVELVDPRDPPNAPAVYTRKSGQSIPPDADKQYIVIEGNAATAVIEDPAGEIAVPRNGCVLVIPDTYSVRVEPGDEVTWRAEPVFRSSAESKAPSFGIFVNPIGPAREHELRIIEEIASGYDIDGIVFDRMRYPNLYADFSPLSRQAFEEWLGRGTIRWPEDIFTISDVPWLAPIPGRYYKEWLEWRARQIRSFAEEAIGLIRSVKPAVKVGAYVGSWYESYYEVGVNWGSRDFHVGYPWMTPEYHRTGFAELFDYICAGCYYPSPTRADARACGKPEGATVEAACQMSRRAVGGASPVYGGLYLRDYRGSPEHLRKAIRVALEHTDGVMLFDLVYLEEYGWWPMLKEVFPSKAIAPHDVVSE